MRVLIVEDELHMRLKVRNYLGCIEGIAIDIDESANGIEAGTYLEAGSYDLMFLDMKMPLMDGLELLEWLKDKGIHQKTVVLSSYNDYDLLRKTMQYQVLDYIYKPLLSIEEVRKAVDIAGSSEQLSKVSEQQQESGAVLGEHQKKAMQVIRRKLERYAEDKGMEKGIAAVCKYTYQTHVEPHSQKEKEVMESIKGIGREIAKQNPDIEMVADFSNYLCFVFDGSKTISEHDRTRKLNTFAERLIKTLSTYANAGAAVGISSIGQGGLPQALDEAEAALNDLFFSPERHHQVYTADIHDDHSLEWKVPFEKIIKRMTKHLEFGEYKAVLTFLEGFPDIYCRDCSNWEKTVLELEELNHLLIHYGIMKDKVDVVDALRSMHVREADKLERVLEQMKAGVEGLMDEDMAMIPAQIGPVTQDVVRYIQLNYAMNIGLEDIADHVDRNSSYVSRTFKNESQMTVTEYLNRVRVVEAKRLLITTDLKIYAVAELVGYRNLDSFHIQFKKYTEMSPNKYRKLYLTGANVKNTDKK